MSAANFALARLATEEGFRAKAYRDTVGKLTIGYGCNIDAGWSEGLARTVLGFQLGEVAEQLGKFAWYTHLDDVRASVLLDIGFNDGVGALLHFPKMLAAVQIGNWSTAAAELMNSEAARELPPRYRKLAEILQTGVP
jgi:lysozyme